MYYLAEVFTTGECKIFNSPKKATEWIRKECLLGDFYRIVNINSERREIHDTRSSTASGQIREIEI